MLALTAASACLFSLPLRSHEVLELHEHRHHVGKLTSAVDHQLRDQRSTRNPELQPLFEALSVRADDSFAVVFSVFRR